MNNKLKTHFPMIRDREELMEIIRKNNRLKSMYDSWDEDRQQEFLNFCTGVKGLKILYDPFFKEALNPEYNPNNLEELLGVLLNRKVKIRQILPNDSTRIADESALLITDIIVELEDGSIANVEIQKIGYHFPGQRSACYSADMLLRQYKRIRNQKKKNFSYHQIKSVFLIILYETSPKEFKKFPQRYIHRSKQHFDSGLELELLQEYVMIPLDIFYRNMQNKPIETILEAWLTFLASDNPEKIIELITKYPDFKPMYETLYQMCRNVEGIMGFFSEELRIMDRNMVKYMVEEQQKELEESQKVIEDQKKEIMKINSQLAERDSQLAERDSQLTERDSQLAERDSRLTESQKRLQEKDIQITNLKKELENLKNNI